MEEKKTNFIDVQLFADSAPANNPAEKKPEDKGLDNGSESKITEPTLQTDYEAEYRKLKVSFDRTSKELAEAKRAEREKMNEEERLKADRENELKQFEEIKKENILIKTKSELNKFVTDEKTLDKISNLFVDGDNIGALKELGAFVQKETSNLRKQIEQELLTKNPTPPPASGDKTPQYKKDDLAKLSYQDIQKLKLEHPETYKELIK